eukprot:2942171-Prymnesium_polylepis.6
MSGLGGAARGTWRLEEHRRRHLAARLVLGHARVVVVRRPGDCRLGVLRSAAPSCASAAASCGRGPPACWLCRGPTGCAACDDAPASRHLASHLAGSMEPGSGRCMWRWAMDCKGECVLAVRV